MSPAQPYGEVFPVTVTVVSGPPFINVRAIYHGTTFYPPGADRSTYMSFKFEGDDGPWSRAADGRLTHGVCDREKLVNGDDFELAVACVKDAAVADIEVWLISFLVADRVGRLPSAAGSSSHLGLPLLFNVGVVAPFAA